MKNQWTCKNPEEYTEICAELFSQDSATNNKVICLQGDLGAGKTTFTQMLGRFLGVSSHIVSPTFTIMKQYETTHHNFQVLNHIDAYRIESLEELGPLHIKETISLPSNISCIEWPEMIREIIPDDAIWLQFEILPDDSRRVTITPGKEQ